MDKLAASLCTVVLLTRTTYLGEQAFDTGASSLSPRLLLLLVGHLLLLSFTLSAALRLASLTLSVLLLCSFRRCQLSPFPRSHLLLSEIPILLTQTEKKRDERC